MIKFEYKGKKYITGIHEYGGFAYPSVYIQRRFLFFKWKEKVYTQDGIIWPYTVAINSTPDRIEYVDRTVVSFFKSHIDSWEGKESPFN